MNDEFMPKSDAVDAPLGRRARKALAVRRALFEAGLAAFDRQPVGMVSVLDITEAADVAKGVFYLHFKSKDDYLLALLSEMHERFLTYAIAAAGDARSAASRVDAVIRAFRHFATEHGRAARFWIRMSSFFPDDVGRPGQLTSIRTSWLRRLAGLLAERESEDVSEDDVRVARALDAACWGLIASACRNDEPLESDALFVRIVRSVVRSATRHES